MDENSTPDMDAGPLADDLLHRPGGQSLFLGRPSRGDPLHRRPPPGKNARELDLRVSPLIGTSPHSVQVDDFNSLTGVDARKAQEAAPLEIELLSPEPGSTLRDNTGNIVFQAQVHPQAPVQYDVRLLLNDKAIPLVHNSLAIRVENLPRGAYEARLELLAKDGTILAKSKAATFYLHRTTVNPAPKATPKAN